MSSTSLFDRIPLVSLENATLPIEEASGLPNALYNDPDVFSLERDHLLGKTWAGAGFKGDLPQLGYVKPITFMGLPLVMIRDVMMRCVYFIMCVAIEVWC